MLLLPAAAASRMAKPEVIHTDGVRIQTCVSIACDCTLNYSALVALFVPRGALSGRQASVLQGGYEPGLPTERLGS